MSGEDGRRLVAVPSERFRRMGDVALLRRRPWVPARVLHARVNAELRIYTRGGARPSAPPLPRLNVTAAAVGR